MAPKRASLSELTAEVGGLASDVVMSGVTRLTAGRIARENTEAGERNASESAAGRPGRRLTVPGPVKPDDLARSLAQSAGQAGRIPRAGSELAGRAINAVVSIVDPNVVLDRIDVQRIVDRVDVQSVVDRVDVDQVVERVDVDRVVDSLDPNRVVERIDVDSVVDRIDVAEVTAEALDAIDIGEVIRESTSSIGSDAIEGARYQAILADGLVSRAVDRVLRRSTPRRTRLEPHDP